MKSKPLPLLLFSVLMLFSFIANAQVLIAYCKIEGGCKFYQTQYSYKDVDGLLGYLGTFEQDKGIMTFFRNKQGQDIHYPDKKRSPKELHAYFGGKGEPSIAKGGVALPFADNVQPSDGNWTVATARPVLKNCPQQLGEQTDKLVSLKSGNKVFSKPFTPTDLLPKGTAWLNTSPGAYKATLVPESAPTFKNLYTFQVKSAELITGTLTTNVAIPNQPTCEVNIDFTYKKQ